MSRIRELQISSLRPTGSYRSDGTEVPLITDRLAITYFSVTPYILDPGGTSTFIPAMECDKHVGRIF